SRGRRGAGAGGSARRAADPRGQQRRGPRLDRDGQQGARRRDPRRGADEVQGRSVAEPPRALAAIKGPWAFVLGPWSQTLTEADLEPFTASGHVWRWRSPN